MHHGILRLIIGLMLIVVAIVVFVRGTLEWWTAAIFLVVGVLFLASSVRLITAARKKG